MEVAINGCVHLLSLHFSLYSVTISCLFETSVHVVYLDLGSYILDNIGCRLVTCGISMFTH